MAATPTPDDLPTPLDGDGNAMALLPTEGALRDLFVAEIRAINPERLDGAGMWFGINQPAVSAEPPHWHKPAEPLLQHLLERDWLKLLCQFDQMGFEPPKNVLIDDGTAENYCVERYDVLAHDTPVAVRYWALELKGNEGESGSKGNSMEPRAQLLCKALTGHAFEYPYHFIYAHVVRLAPQIDDAPRSVRAPIVEQEQELMGFAGMKKGFLAALPTTQPKAKAKPHEIAQTGRSGGEDVPVWTDAPAPKDDDARDPWEMRAEAEALKSKAEAQASLGDHTSAYATASDAIALQLRASRAEETMAICSGDEPDTELDAGAEEAADADADGGTGPTPTPTPPAPRKTYFPEAQYLYPDGHTRTVAAGMYTQDEFITRTMEEQARWAGAMEAVQNAAAHESDGEGEGEEV